MTLSKTTLLRMRMTVFLRGFQPVIRIKTV